MSDPTYSKLCMIFIALFLASCSVNERIPPALVTETALSSGGTLITDNPTFVITQVTATPSQTPTLTPTLTLTPTSTPSLTPTEVRNVLFEQNFEGDLGNFRFRQETEGIGSSGVTTDGQNNVFEAINLTSDASTETSIFLRDLFLDGIIQFKFIYKDFINEGNEGDGSIDFHFRLQQSSDEESYVVSIRPASETVQLYYVDPTGKWTGSSLRTNSFPYDEDKWFLVRIEVIGQEIKVYLGEASEAEPELKFTAEEQRITTPGEVDLYIRQNLHIQLDDMQVLVLP